MSETNSSVRLKYGAFGALTTSIVLFILGLVYPLLATKKELFGILLDYQNIRLLDSVKIFFQEGDVFLGMVILIFTFIFPTLKYIDLGVRLIRPAMISQRLSSTLRFLDRWSMLDVFLVALLLLNAKMDSTIIVMDLKIGTTFLALSIILRMIASELIVRKNENPTPLPN